MVWFSLLEPVPNQIGSVDDDQLVVARYDTERISVIGVITGIEFGLYDRGETPEVPLDEGESVPVVILVRKRIFDDLARDPRDGPDPSFVSDYLNESQI
jgi:hypothetical protein